MTKYRPMFGDTPVVVKNLIIINVLMLLATYIFRQTGISLTDKLGMHYPASENFRLYQIITHMFMHGGIAHLFFNMFALWMFGRILENVWGPRRFMVYYFITGLGAVALHTFVNYLEFNSMQHAIVAFGNTPAPEILEKFVDKNRYIFNMVLSSDEFRKLNDFVSNYYD